HVAIGTVTAHNVDRPALLAEFHDDHPAVEITLAEDNSDQLIAALRGGQLDAAIIALGATPPPDLEIHIVADEPIAAAVSHSDDLATRSTIPLTDLRDRVLISLPPGTGIRSLLDDACAAAGFTPHIAFEASSPLVLALLAARGLGVAIVPAALAAAREDLHPLTITRPELRGRLAFAWRNQGPISPATRALVGRARRMLTT
ncbi:MAG: LysR substrate-binding domain-containing protein, partial [Pseudonocardiaceae bacterium]